MFGKNLCSGDFLPSVFYHKDGHFVSLDLENQKTKGLGGLLSDFGFEWFSFICFEDRLSRFLLQLILKFTDKQPTD